MKNHNRNRILTVLASGEPYDVIPEILLYEDIKDPATGEMIRVPIEPLSCDWRIKRRQAIREELPRLAAPLLFCSYDELRQRQRQYRTQRLITVFSFSLAASLGLAAYFLQTSITIQKNLDRAHRNQSLHLATESLERLSAGDKLTAIALATAALPDETENRPYVPKAEYALIEALNLYQDNAKIVAVGAVSPGNQAVLQDFWSNSTGKRLYLYDTRKHVTVWDTTTLEKLGDWDYSETPISTFIPLANNPALVKDSYNNLKCLSEDGSCHWQLENCIDVKVTEDENQVLVIHKKDSSTYELLFLDPQTGKQLRNPMSLNLFSESTMPSGFYSCNVEEGLPIVMKYSALPETKIYMLDWNTGEYRELPAEIAQSAKGYITSDNKMIVMSESKSEQFTGLFENNRINATLYTTVSCFNLEKAEKVWQSEITSPVSGESSLNILPDGKRILCHCGPVFQTFDITTGQILNRCEAGSSAITLSIGDTYAQAILEDGHLCNYWYDENYCYENKLLQSDLYRAKIGETLFSMHRNDNQVTIYRNVDPSILWKHDAKYVIRITDQRIHNNQWLITDNSTLHLFDLDTHQIRWTQQDYVNKLLGFSPDGKQFWYINQENILQIVDTVTGEINSQILVAENDRIYDAYFTRDYVFYTTNTSLSEDTLQPFVTMMDVNTMEKTTFHLPATDINGQSIQYNILGQHESSLWLWETNGNLLELNLKKDTHQILLDNISQYPKFAINEKDSSIALANADEVILMNTSSKKIQTFIMEENALAGSLYYYDNNLLVLCDNGYLYRYDSDGTILNRIALDVGDVFSRDLLDIQKATEAKVSYSITSSGKLVVNAFSYGNIIDTNTWEKSASIPNFQLYDGINNLFVCNGNSGICGYPSYTLQELREIAQTKLANYQLTPAEKTAYGLE